MARSIKRPMIIALMAACLLFTACDAFAVIPAASASGVAATTGPAATQERTLPPAPSPTMEPTVEATTEPTATESPTPEPTPTPAPEPAEMSLLFTGDIMFQRAAVIAAKQKDETYSFAGWFDAIKQQVSAADYAIGNLEGPIYPPAKSVMERKRFTAPREAAVALKDAGFDVLDIANNHAMDQGRTALDNTLSVFKELGIISAGGYSSPDNNRKMVILEKNGIKAALFCYANRSNRGFGRVGEYGIYSVSKADFKADVREAQDNGCSITIFFVHMGTEYTHNVDRNQKNIAKLVRDAGGDILIGCHPHVIQPIEVFPADATHGKKFLAVWSLGNLCRDDWGIQTLSIMLEVTLKQGPDGTVAVDGYTFTPMMSLTTNVPRGRNVRVISLDEALSAYTAGDPFYKSFGKQLKTCKAAALKILGTDHWKKAGDGQ